MNARFNSYQEIDYLDRQRKTLSRFFGIGGLGGSGTRVVAKVLIEAGMYLGDDLNDEKDNLVFCRLFKDPEWYSKAGQADIERRFRIFEDYMAGRSWTTSQALEYFCSTRRRLVRDNRILHHLRFAAERLFAATEPRDFWGWKEPNTQIILDKIRNCGNAFRYIHVIRHGLEMAFSNNKQQLLNWGPMYGVIVNDMNDGQEIAAKQLEFWIRINKLVLAICSEHLPGKHVVINYDRLWNDPVEEIRKLLKFTGIEYDDQIIARLAGIPKLNKSRGRYKTQDLSGITAQQLQEVRDLGFDIGGSTSSSGKEEAPPISNSGLIHGTR